jgi:DNA-directed RNA polymerase beta' subunit
MNNIKYTILQNDIVNSIPILINSTNNNNNLNTVRSSKLGGTKFYYCTTCPLSQETGDLGHPGKLPLPDDLFIIKPCYIKLITNLLNNTLILCPNCLMLKNNIILSSILKKYNFVYSKEMKDEILNELSNKQNIKCLNPNCNATGNSTYKFNYQKNNFISKLKNSKASEITISTSNIYNMFSGISKLIYKCLSSNLSYKEINPCESIFTNALLIPSIYTRMPVIYDNKESNLITSKLNQLVGSIYSSNTEKKKEKPQSILIDLDNDKGISPYKKNNLVNLDILTSGSKKEGLLRGYIVGRRQNNSARCVASPGNKEDIGYINIPKLVAKKLVNSIHYNKFSENYIKYLLENTGIVSFIILSDETSDINRNKLIKLKKNSKIPNFLRLKYGDRIEIPLKNDDCILFSRQPSLHKYNIQCGIIKIWDNNTIGISTAIANSLNGDFDGDEINLQKLLINDLEAMIKMTSVAIIKNNYSMAPMFGLIQDQLIAIHTLYILKNISRDKAIMLLGKYSYFIKDINKLEYTGSEILSLIFPSNLTYGNIFKNGNLIINTINADQLVSQSYDALINIISQYQNDISAVSILDILIHISINFLNIYGFSVTLDDLIPDINFLKYIDNYINNGLVIINSRLNKFIENINNVSFNYDLDYMRNDDCAYLIKKVQDQVIEMYNTKGSKYNAILRMKNSKYKVNDAELTSMVGMGGFPYSSENIPKKNIMGRCFYTELPGDIDPKSYGLITSSLLKGNTFMESCYICKYLSLINIVKTTCETSSSGTIGKKLVKFLENVIIDSYGMVILNKRVVLNNYNFIKILGSDSSRTLIILPNDKMTNYKIIKNLFDNNIKLHMVYNFGKKIMKDIIFPINIQLFLESYIHKEGEVEISNYDLLKKIDDFILKCQTDIYIYLGNLNWLLYTLYTYFDLYYLTSINKKLTNEITDFILNKIYFKLITSINAGYPIGLEYAHNIQEKFTQQSLSSFHTSKKSGEQQLKIGFTEFKDTVELSKKDRHDIVTLYSNDYDKLLKIKEQMEYVDLEMIEANIELQSESSVFVIYTITINEHKLQNKINIYNLTDIVYIFLENCIIIKSYWVSLNIVNNSIIYTIGVKFSEPININKYFFQIGLEKGISKGKDENIDLIIEDITVYNKNTLLEEKNYSLTLYINNITDLSYFDTENVHIEMGYWFTFATNGIQLAEYAIHHRLLQSTKEENMENCYRLLSKVMCMDSIASSIKKLKDSKNSIIKAAIHGMSDSIINASWNNMKESNNDIYSNIFCGNKSRKSHGYYEYYYDINQYNRIKIKEPKIILDREIKINNII